MRGRAGVHFAAALGAVAGGATFVVYMLDAGRSLNYDSSVTVGSFIATPSVTDALTRQSAFNNHPILSFLDHVVYSLGGTSEVALRVVPAAFGAATVGLLAYWSARRWTVWAGTAAALVLATNPLFAELSREVRGYSILAFSAVASSILFEELIAGRRGWRVPAYVVALALGIATHLFSGLVLVAHVGVIAYRRELSRDWVKRWAIAVVAGCVVYIGMAKAMAAYVLRNQARVFDASFPLDTVREALGHYPVAVVLLAVLVGVAVWQRRRSDLVPVGVGLTALVLLLWLGPSPNYLAPRFFVALVPAVAVACAAVVARWPVALVPVVIASLVLAGEQWGRWDDEEFPSRQVAAYVRSVQDDGGRACGIRYSGEPLWAYVDNPKSVLDKRDLAKCQIVVAIPSHPLERPLVAEAGRQFPHHWREHASNDMLIFSRVPRERLRPLPAIEVARASQ